MRRCCDYRLVELRMRDNGGVTCIGLGFVNRLAYSQSRWESVVRVCLTSKNYKRKMRDQLGALQQICLSRVTGAFVKDDFVSRPVYLSLIHI